jgi:hypothetical protein
MAYCWVPSASLTTAGLAAMRRFTSARLPLKAATWIGAMTGRADLPAKPLPSPKRLAQSLLISGAAPLLDPAPPSLEVEARERPPFEL